MNTGKHSLIWSAVLLLLMLSVAVPLLNMVSVLLMMVPYIVLYATRSRRAFSLHVVLVWVIAYLLIGPLALMIGLFFLVPSIIMGHLIAKQTPPGRVLVSGILSLLGIMLLGLLLFNVVYGTSLVDELGNSARDTMNQLMKDGLLPGSWSADLTDDVVRMMTQSIPVALIMVSFVYAVVAQFLSRKALNRAGLRVPAMPQAHEWKLPRIMVLYYLVSLVLTMVLPSDDSYLSVALLNLVPLLQTAFTIQTIGFFYYIAHQRGWPKFAPLLIGIVVVLLQPVTPVSLIGVLDTAFPIRKAFEKKR